ncbi:hypothetical protein Ddc_18733 [Ditylenchus destructor]|nr:hypothetical protein Ddc_18733 [Ditylenchus destructor]
MENILHSCTQFSPLLYIAVLFIFAAFVILVFFVYGRDRKKPYKVCRRPVIDLSSDSLHDILAFFDRKYLSRQRSVNSRFNQTIQREFASKPYLVLEELGISESTAEKTVRNQGRFIVDKVMVDQILAEKFVRFKHADVMCNDRAQVTNLLSMSEPWQTYDLRLSAEFKLTKFYARQLAKCKKVNSISFRGRLTLLPEFLFGNCLKLTVSDDIFKTEDSASVPWTKILDFLFRPSESDARRRRVEITTKEQPRAAEYLQFFDEMKQRFANATTRVYFYFNWRRNAVPLFQNEEVIENIHTGQKLFFNQIN